MVKLVIKKVKKSFKVDEREVAILGDISFSVNKRESIGIVGPSGCGKTTLIRLIAGLESPSSGSISFQDETITKPTKGIMMVFQSSALLPWKTVLENVELALLDRGKDNRRAIATRYLDLVGLDGSEHSYPKELSNGMRQRAGIARAICTSPEILILDEPFSSLDPLSSNNLRNEILKLYQDRKLKPVVLIIVGHNLQEIVAMCDRVLVMSRRPARIVADVKIPLPYPRNSNTRKFRKYVDKITSLIV